MTASPQEPGMLLEAIRSNDIEAAKKLLEQGADPNERDDNDNTPLTFAASRSSELVALLIDKGADVNAKNSIGITPLTLCLVAGASTLDPAIHFKTLRLLIKNGVDLEGPNHIGKTPADWARSLGNNKAEKIIRNVLQNRKRQAKINAERTRLSDIHNIAVTKQRALNRPSRIIIRKSVPRFLLPLGEG